MPRLSLPYIQLHCDSPLCHGVRYFEADNNGIYLDKNRYREHFTTYTCRNCGVTKKTYAFWGKVGDDGISVTLMKFGEYPPFGPHTPARVITIIGGERDYFLKGRRAENLDLGIAAFAYYRRVVENQKFRIINEIIRVAEKVGASEAVISDLKSALDETQFSSAVEAVKHGIPQSLLINGHNPLTLLHSALSEGLHAQTDEECLELARSIRVVLTELVERIDIALKEEAELNTAVSRLLNKSARKMDGACGN